MVTIQSQFLSTPSARRATLCRWCGQHNSDISIHALREEGDKHGLLQASRRADFYPRPPRGGRPLKRVSSRKIWLFLSTPSARRATWQGGCDYDLQLISIHALREEGDGFVDLSGYVEKISIHALREEGDWLALSAFGLSTDFYPRPPRGGRLFPRSVQQDFCRFLSTPSARRATNIAARRVAVGEDFYPRPPRGGRH